MSLVICPDCHERIVDNVCACTEFMPGDIIIPKQHGASRLKVLWPTRTTHGKLRLLRIDSEPPTYTTAWWTHVVSLPSGFRREAR
jgi:hypothetical protein